MNQWLLNYLNILEIIMIDYMVNLILLLKICLILTSYLTLYK